MTAFSPGSRLWAYVPLSMSLGQQARQKKIKTIPSPKAAPLAPPSQLLKLYWFLTSLYPASYLQNTLNPEGYTAPMCLSGEHQHPFSRFQSKIMPWKSVPCMINSLLFSLLQQIFNMSFQPPSPAELLTGGEWELNLPPLSCDEKITNTGSKWSSNCNNKTRAKHIPPGMSRNPSCITFCQCQQVVRWVCLPLQIIPMARFLVEYVSLANHLVNKMPENVKMLNTVPQGQRWRLEMACFVWLIVRNPNISFLMFWNTEKHQSFTMGHFLWMTLTRKNIC